MILIADSGSTKTDWRLVDDDKQIHQFATIGFNPYFQSTQEIAEELSKRLLPNLKVNTADLQIYFYGAGCSNKQKCDVVRDALWNVFSSKKIAVNHDLLAAARALCGDRPGIAAILGTGSNSCYYDGEKIVENISSLGFFLGDEGSGAYIGKTFIQAYLNKELPESIYQRFFDRYKLSKDDILENVYKKPMPNKYLASFSKFIYQNIKEEYLQNLVYRCFEDFFKKHISKYKLYQEIPFHCVGSVGFYYSDLLKQVAKQYGINTGNIIESPIAALTLYHLENC